MLQQTICVGMCSVTFSQASEDGVMPSDWQVGQTMSLFGPDPAHASHSPRQVKCSDLGTSAIYGLSYIGLYTPPQLRLSLVSRLRDRLEKHGWIPWSSILKVHITSSPVSFRLVRWDRRKKENGFILLPTPSAQQQQGGIKPGGGQRATAAFRAAGMEPKEMSPSFVIGMSCWQMGYPVEWLKNAPVGLVMPSSRKLRRNS